MAIINHNHENEYRYSSVASWSELGQACKRQAGPDRTRNCHCNDPSFPGLRDVSASTSGIDNTCTLPSHLPMGKSDTIPRFGYIFYFSFSCSFAPGISGSGYMILPPVHLHPTPGSRSRSCGPALQLIVIHENG